ncbi:MAG: hypothetical protein GX591_14035 [Planctomycetes bacterium]|nr:hypothetical protein [Planctomycetota bacterium]
MNTPIATLRCVAAAQGGLAKATDAQLRRWWSTLDHLTRAALAAAAGDTHEETHDADPAEPARDVPADAEER